MSIDHNVAGDIQRAVTAASRYFGDPNPANATLLDDNLKVLIQAVSSIDRAGRLSLQNESLLELLNQSHQLLTDSTTSISTMSKITKFLFNLAIHNIPIRRHLAVHMEMCGAVWNCLQVSISQQLGPQHLIEVLRLMQVLTYQKGVVLGHWANEFISFLITEIIQVPESEWMPYCIAILCNLSCRSKSAGARIRKSSNYKLLSKRLVKLLQHDSRMVVVSSLILIGYLDQAIRDVVFNTRNMSPTFQCVFNVLILGDCLMTRHIACDLLKRLVVSDAPTVSSHAVITSIGKDLICYPYFSRCIQQTANLLVNMNPQVEEAAKIYDLLLSLCSVSSICSHLCDAILKAPPPEGSNFTPVYVIARTARLPFSECVDPLTPIRALKMLNYLMKEAIDTSQRAADYVPNEHLLSTVEYNVKLTLDTGSELVAMQCERIKEGLGLTEVLCTETDDKQFHSRLMDAASPALCAHLAESQLMTNPIVLHMSKAPAHRKKDEMPEWSLEGVSLVLRLLRLLATLKDFSKAHKNQYWLSLKDERLIPFLAYAISYGEHQMVYDALTIYTHCSQVQAFPSNWLADLIASCTLTKQLQEDKKKHNESLDTSDDNRRSVEPRVVTPTDPAKDVNVEELLERLRKGADVRDVRISEILGAFEKKLSLMERKERELEGMLSAKDAALAQSEKLRVQYRNGQGSNEDLSRIRSLMVEQERLTDDVTRLTKDLQDVRNEKELLLEENRNERELAVQLRNARENMREKFEVASKAALEKQELCTELIKQKQNARDELEVARSDFAKSNAAKEAEIEKLRLLVVESEKREADGQRRQREEKERMETDMQRKLEAMRQLHNNEKARLEREHAEYRERTDAELNGLRGQLSSAASDGERTKQEMERMKKLKEEMLKLAGNF